MNCEKSWSEFGQRLNRKDCRYTVSTLAQLGFSGTVSLSASGLPAGATASFSSSAIGTPGSAILTVTAAATTLAGSSTLTITGTSGSLTHGVTATLTVGSAGTVIPQSGWSLLYFASRDRVQDGVPCW